MDFAIVGMDCLLPGAADAEEWIARARTGEPALSEVPAGRWPMDPTGAVATHKGELDRTTTITGGFVTDPPFDPTGLDLDGVPIEDVDPLFRWVLRVCRRAVDGVKGVGPRTDLLLANLSLASTGAIRAASGPYRDWLREAGQDVSWLEGGTDWDRKQSESPALLAAHALRLGGEATAIDAACASGLYAVRLATDRLATGRADVAIAAGVQRADSCYVHLGFSQLRALSKKGIPRPLDRRSDGLVVGEGAAAVVLKRLADAVADGDTIHAVVRGGALGNDGRKGNLLAPDGDGQLRVLRDAYLRTGVSPADIGFVECHATGTPVGDGVEVAALAALHAGRTTPLPLSSAKGITGHLITVAGLAGLIRAVGAVRDGFIPPSPWATEPLPALDQGSALHVVHEPTPWTATSRRAGVSAFGFGGTNAHLIVEQYTEQTGSPISEPAPALQAAVVGLGARLGPATDLATVASALLGGTSLRWASPESLTRGRVPPRQGAWIDALEIDPTRFRIPPTELARILPQHLAILLAADDALMPLTGIDRARTAVVMGMGLDLHIGDPVVRQVPRDAALADAIAPAMDAGRVQGVLPNFVANRISALLDLQGPSYTVSAGALSGLVALEHGRRLLQSGEVDAVVVGASDFAGHLGHLAETEAPLAEGAIALVLRRPDDARTAGEPVHALVGPVALGADAKEVFSEACRAAGIGPRALGLWCADPASLPLARGKQTAKATPRAITGDGGALDGAMSLLLAVLALGQRRLPIWVGPRPDGVTGVFPKHEGTWRHRGKQPRTAGVAATAPLGRHAAVVLTEGDPAESKAGPLFDPLRISAEAIHGSTGPGAVAPIRVPHSGPPLPAHVAAAWSGSWGGDTVPAPLPRRGGDALAVAEFAGAAMPGTQPLFWERWVGAATSRPRRATPRSAPVPTPRPARPPATPRTAGVQAATRAAVSAAQSLRTAVSAAQAPAALPPVQALDPAGVAELAASLSRSTSAMADAHEAFLAQQRAATAQIAAVGAMLERALEALESGPPVAESLQPVAPSPQPAARRPPPEAGSFLPPTSTPRSFDRAALEHFANGPISEVLGPAYADLDAYEPRVRLPEPPLLLVSRVIDVEGERGQLGPARIITEYDLPVDAAWAHDGKAPPCVIVESGQADLFLCAYLGTDDVCRGDRVYRLLDCDLAFHDERPRAGETLRHDIRIKQFARLGDTLLFYFEYDCISTTDGRSILSMRNGVAGFFTPAELATPMGIGAEPADKPGRSALPPRVPGAPTSLDDGAMSALKRGRHSEALGPDFAPGDGSLLRPPPSEWGLLDRAPVVAVSGGPFGLGRVVAEQDLHDDDWFNPVHFYGDPCMPGTLMFDGCTQALSLWLLAMGFATDTPDATFEPLPDLPCKLRCRGQVVPGHSKLTYEVQVTEAGVQPTPWAIADVVLFVDGLPVVRAEDVSVRIVPRTGAVAQVEPQPDQVVAEDGPAVDEPRVLEFSIGDPSRAFGPAFLPFDQERRTARMPGCPYLVLSRAEVVDAPPLVLAADTAVTMAYDVPPEAWYFAADPLSTMPYAVLLEVGLQPCGWLTAWAGATLDSPRDLYFRNLGGKAVQRAPVPRDIGTLHTRATLTQVSESAGMSLVFFDFEVRAGDTVVFAGDTHFGYFTDSALANQKGLRPPAAELANYDAWRATATGETADLSQWDSPWCPRNDWRCVDRVTVVSPAGGSAGLGYYEAQADVDPRTWFFTAHFHQDPVMPGSLGLEALLQLARWVLEREVGTVDGVIEPLTLGQEHSWVYRGQVIQDREHITLQLEVLEIDRGPQPTIRCSGLLLADDLPIYRFKDFGLRIVPAPAASAAPTPAPRATAVAALLDQFTVDGDAGTGVLHLDPDQHPWLAAHQPTLVVPAVPMAFAAEIAAEAAQLLRPDKKVVGLPSVDALKWIHTGEGPVDLLVAAVVEGDTVAVSLAITTENKRFPKLSGPVVHMKAMVELGDAWHPEPPVLAPLPDAQPVELPIRTYYDSGYTFHGPVLQGMVSLDLRSANGATATFATRPDADLLAPGSPAFLLDPLLLDVATHPMMSGVPEIWVDGLSPGKLAYPVRCEGLRFHGPRPTGPVSCRLDRVQADRQVLVFDVRLSSEAGVWASFRWTEAMVDGGPLLGQDPDTIGRFCKQRLAAEVRVGRPTAAGHWQVDRDDLVEPLVGSMARLLCTPAELVDWRTAPDRPAWEIARFAAKEAVRSWLRSRLGRDVHPATLQLVAMRPDRYVVTEAFTLTAQEYIDHIGPTRFDLCLRADGDVAEAWIAPR